VVELGELRLRAVRLEGQEGYLVQEELLLDIEARQLEELYDGAVLLLLDDAVLADLEPEELLDVDVLRIRAETVVDDVLLL